MEDTVKFVNNVMYIQNYSKWYRVTAMFTNKTRANNHMAVVNVGEGTDEGVILVASECIFLAGMSDPGLEELPKL